MEFADFLLRKEINSKFFDKQGQQNDIFSSDAKFSNLQFDIFLLIADDLLKKFLDAEDTCFESAEKYRSKINKTIEMIPQVDQLRNDSGDCIELFKWENAFEPSTLKNLTHYLGTSLGMLSKHYSKLWENKQVTKLAEISRAVKDTCKMLILHTSRTSVKYTFSTLYTVSFDIYQEQDNEFEFASVSSNQKSIRATFIEDTIFVGELIKGSITHLRDIHSQGEGGKEITSIIEKVNKVSLKAIGYLAEVYLESKEYEKARLSIEYWFSIGSEKSEEELNSLITLFKYYLKLNREEDVLNIINTIVEHPKIDSETVAIVLSTTLKYK